MDLQNIQDNIYPSLKFKDEKIFTKKHYRLAFLKHPVYYLSRKNFLELFAIYIGSPNKTCFKRYMRLRLFIDKIIQNIRNAIKFIFVDSPILLLSIIMLIIGFLDHSMHLKIMAVILIFIGFIFKVPSYIFYIGDHILSIFSTFKSAIKGSSSYFASSYLDLTKIRSDKFDFLYFDNSIDDDTRELYEEWTDELMNKFNILSNFKFNIFIADEQSNIINESRKMIAIYDSPYQKVYENNSALLGLYSSAAATVISKNISKEYFDDILNIFDGFEISSDILHFSNDNTYFKKYQFYHEISHLITIDLDSTLLENENCTSIFDREKFILHPIENEYFLRDIKEYVAESLARYILEGRVGNLDIDVDFKTTDTYKMIENYCNRLIKTKL